jgi:hypothetical protein
VRGNVVNGELVDEWQQPIQYYLTSPAYSNPLPTLVGAPPGNFTICPTPVVCSPPSTTVIASNVVAVLLSTGDYPTPASPNPIAPLPNANFYSDVPKTTFDDIVVWISQPELIFAISKTK